jgi:hypothetical protein
MNLDTELRVDQARHLARLHGRTGALVLLDHQHHFGRQLVRRLWASGLRQQSCETVALEGRFGLVEGWPREAEQARRLGLGDASLPCMSQHLVLHLQQIVGIEEPSRMKPVGLNPLGLRIEHPGLAQTVELGWRFGHGGCSDIYVKNNMPRLSKLQGVILAALLEV